MRGTAPEQIYFYANVDYGIGCQQSKVFESVVVGVASENHGWASRMVAAVVLDVRKVASTCDACMWRDDELDCAG
ncbi:MAG: hypothetical protein L0H70_05115 [Xanthomonadales bacterium]|nr:hypothetical protein [Xanthomonadales bacterium]